MNKVTTFFTRTLFVVAIVSLTMAMTVTAWGQVKFEENFNYTAGTLLTANGWTAHSGAGTNAHKVSTVGLSYSGYASSGIALADSFTTNGEDVNKVYATFPNGTAGSGTNHYYSFMVNLDSSTATGDYFVHLQKGATTFTARVFAKRNAGDGQIQFGIGKTSTIANINFSAGTFTKGTTHLIVVKYSIIAGATNDTLAMWVDPTLGGSEPAPLVLESALDKGGADVDTTYAMAVRQGTAANAPIGRVDGFRIGASWQDVTGPLAAPTVTTGAATTVTSTTATLNGNVNPNNASTTDTFDYGTTLSYGSSVSAAQSPITAGGNAVATSAAITGLTPNQLYHFRDPATNSQGTTDGADATFTTVPAAPTTTAATSNTASDFTANWTPGAGNAPATYELDVATDAGFTSLVSGYNPMTGISGTSQSVTGLTAGSTYYYRVRGVDVGGTSANSNTTSTLTTPGAPTANAPTGVSASSFTANWTTPGGTVTDYRLDVSTANDFSSFVTGYNDKTVAATSDAVTGLGTGIKYYYRVRAVNGGGTSANSNIDSATTISLSEPSLSAPTATAITTSTATLGATVDTDNNDPDTERGVVYALTANPTTADTKIIEGSTGVGTFTVGATGLPPGTLIHYRGYAINGQGTGYTSDATFYTLNTEPSTHAGSFSATAVSPTSIDLSWTAATGADGYIIIQRTGSDPTGTPSDATAYAVSNTIGDGTVAAIVGPVTLTTITGLTGGTNYHYSIMPFSWDGANAGTYNYKTDPTVPTSNATTLSSESDIIATPGFVYASNINYALYTSVVNIDTSNSVAAFGFTVRDGGAGTDADGAPTVLTGISFSLTNATAITRAAIYDGPTELAEAAVVGSSVSFSSFSASTGTDGGTHDLILRVAYNTTVTDNSQNTYTVSAVIASPAGSSFAAANAGGATSSSAGDDNRIEVTGTQLSFVGPIANGSPNTNFTASTKWIDGNFNTDLDYTGVVTFSKESGPGTLSGSLTPSSVAGVATSTDLQFNLGGTYRLYASTQALPATTSNQFVIVSPALFYVAGPAIEPTAGRGFNSTDAVDTLDWNSPATWTAVSGGSATGFPGRKDTVVMDNTYKAGSYVVTVGKVVSDSIAKIRIGYPGNTNEITLLIPRSSTIAPALSFGNNAPGNYDMTVDQGGVMYNQTGRASGTVLSILGFAAAGDSILIKTGGRLIHNTGTSISGIMIGISKDLAASGGTLEVRMPKTFVGTFHLTIAGFVAPNLLLAADSVANFDASTSQASAFGSFFLTQNLTIGPNTTFLAGQGGTSYEGDYFIKGNIINNGTLTFGVNNTLAMVGSSPQSISGNPVGLKKGFFMGNPAGVTLATNLGDSIGAITTTGTLNYLQPEFPTNIFPIAAAGVLNTGSSTIFLNPSGTMNEGANPVQGNVSVTRTALQNVNQTFGTVGVEINAAGGAPGVTTVGRKTGVASTGNAHSSILRYYDIAPTLNSALNAAFKLSYTTSELNGNLETDLLLHKSTDLGATWTGKSGTVSTGLHQISTTGVQNFSRWTAAAASAPLFITHTITVRKVQDTDGDVFTTGDQSLKKWRLSLYRDSISAGTLMNTQNLNSGIMATTNLEAGTYISTEEDSAGWLHLGKVHNGTTIAGGTKYDTVTVSGGVAANIDFINQQVSSLVVRKFLDTDGDAATIESPKQWHLAIYKGSVSGGNLVAEADTSELVANSIQAGTYIVTEADSGASWVRLNGNQTLSDTIVVPANVAIYDTLINFQPNTIVVNKFEDNDGQFSTSGDRTPKAWYMEVRQGSSGGAVLASGNSGNITMNGVGDGTYYISESDSAGWLHLGQVVNGSPVSTSSNNRTVTISGGQTATVDFVNAPPIYSQLFRSFNADSIALDKDNFGKVGKYVKRKADKDYFKFAVTSPNRALHLSITMKFGMLTTGAITRGLTKVETLFVWSNLKDVTTPLLDTGLVFQVEGTGYKGKQVKVSFSWATSPKVTKGTVVTYMRNQPKLPMPNRVNVLLETFEQGAFNSTTGLPVGLAKTDSAKLYAWYRAPKYSDVLKTLSDKTGRHNLASPRVLAYYDNTKLMKGILKTLPPSKQNNGFLANLIALKLNIAASALGKTPPGFGELVYDGVDTAETNHNYFLAGMMIKDIAKKADTVITGFYFNSTHAGNVNALSAMNEVIRKINSAFEGKMDTLDFETKLHLKGTKMLSDVPFLRAVPGIEPTILAPEVASELQVPTTYALNQNYPNPFNPTTMISFELPEQAFVTLKVYNVLGQEVATLVDHQLMDDGAQELQFNAGSLASGVYFYRLIADGMDDEGITTTSFSTVKKMLLVK